MTLSVFILDISKYVRFLQLLNAPDEFPSDGVTKFDRLSDVNEKQSLNIYLIELIFVMLKPDKSNEDNKLHPSNIKPISVTLDVSNEDKFKEVRDEQYLNI